MTKPIVRCVVQAALLLFCLGSWSSSGAQAKSKSQKKVAHGSSRSAAQKPAHAAQARTKSSARNVHGKAAARGKAGRGAKRTPARGSKRHRALSARAVRLVTAFQASAELRPMAQQLGQTRSPAAFAGVQHYAATHPGDGASAAHLALGHALSLDHRYPEAVAQFRLASSSDALGDYADYLGAQAAIRAGQLDVASTQLRDFAQRHPDSIFLATAPVLLATIALQSGNSAEAIHVLESLRDTPAARSPDFRYALGRAYQTSGATARAATVYRELYTHSPTNPEAAQARQQLDAMGVPLSAAERKVHADQLFNAHRYAEAADEYHSIEQGDSTLSAADRDALKIYAAVCDLRLKRANRREIDGLPVTNDDSAALKLYMLAELSRSEGDRGTHDSLIAQLVDHYPASRWTEEALYSGGNMYLLLHDWTQTIYHYRLLVRMFPDSTYAPSAHWRMAWLNYRMRQYAEAARLMEEQITRYPGGQEIPSALYWRGRIAEDEEHHTTTAAAYYSALTEVYTNFYYSLLARQRLKAIGPQEVPALPLLAGVRRSPTPDLSDELPEEDPHLITARLLANAALNEYIGPEIDAADDSAEWGALAQADIYSSFGETTRSLQSIKHSGLPFFTFPVDEVPVNYWHLLFPRPFWPEIVSNSQSNGLDPYLVASLIRQESEFNAGAVSRANAYGLMQLLPSVGKVLAKRRGMRGFNAASLLNPTTNLQLGTVNLRQVLDRYNGQPEYALAAYNAGDVPVRQWMSSGDYKDTAEWVESIPYSETREYVQAILRNREMYRAVYGAGH